MITILLASLLLPITVMGTSFLDSLSSILREDDEFIAAQLYRPQPIDREYDFIIAGGGTAGCVLAARLSENPNWRILLLEAGGPEPFAADIPILVAPLRDTSLDWHYEAAQNPNNCNGFKNGRCPIRRGKLLGGGSVFNSMVFTRGNPKDYDQWEAIGNKGWSYKEVLPYFKKLENMTIPNLRISSFYGKKGPVQVTGNKYRSVLSESFLDAGRELGHDVGDYNTENQSVFAYLQFNINERGRRDSVTRAYILPIIDERKNLQVVLNAFVRKILVQKRRAYGVEVEYNGDVIQIKAAKEVIVSGGTINSAQLLMLSGIGPKDHLRDMGIPLMKHLPVGQNFQDHVTVGSLIFITNVTEPELFADDIKNNPKHFVDFVEKGYGPYELSTGSEALCFVDTSSPLDPNGFPDIELQFATTTPLPSNPAKEFKPEFEKVFEPTESKATFSTALRLLKPKSVGYVQLQSKDPHDHPIIAPNYFDDPEDAQILLKGVRYVQQIVNTKAFQKYGAYLNDVPVPGCEKETFNSDEYWFCVMKVWTVPSNHEFGSCQMGSHGVVDERLRVYGIASLRVIDGSIFPTSLSAHTHIPTIMTAEKGADMIKEDSYSTSMSFWDLLAQFLNAQD